MIYQERISLITSRTADKAFNFEVDSTILAATPTWNSESEAVPLPLSEAIRIGTTQACAQRPRFDSCVCTVVNIQAVDPRTWPSHWYYFLVFAPRMDERIYDEDRIEIVILLDGTVVEPIVSAADDWPTWGQEV